MGLGTFLSNHLTRSLEIGQRGIYTVLSDNWHDSADTHPSSFACMGRQRSQAATLVDPEHLVSQMRRQGVHQGTVVGIALPGIANGIKIRYPDESLADLLNH